MAVHPPSPKAPAGANDDSRGVRSDSADERVTIDFRLLGPLDIFVDGVSQPMPGGKPKGVLALLLMNRNRVVSADSLADAIWDGEPPAAYQGILQVYLSTVRRSLRAAGADGQAVVSTQNPGYKLSIDEASVDLGRFIRRVSAGNELLRAKRHEEAAGMLRAALGEWSGPALADLRGLRFADAFAAAVEEDRLVALHACIDAELACGMESQLIGELTTLTSQHPLREPFWVQLITALYRLGRQADALDAGRRIRELLGDELGIDPGPALRDLEGRILRQESLAPVLATTPPATPPPVMLPHDEPPPGTPPSARPSPAAPTPAMQPTVSETAMVLSIAQLVLPSGRTIPVPARGLRIGRMADNDLVIDGVKVSRYHAVVVEMAQGFAVNDLRSTNGTIVGGQRVLDSHFLHGGDVITIGGVDMIFEITG